MKPIPRTVSEVGVDEPAPRSLADYRDDPALLLVGDAGSGKTTEFRGECDALAGRGEFVTAREFINLGCTTDLTEKTLFIDGLDEVRAEVGDLRKPLDAIVRRLHDLGRPRFRLSCRALDLGRTDVETLEGVSPNGSVRLVRLDPLRDSDIDELIQPLVGKLVEESLHKPASSEGRALFDAFVLADGAPRFLEEARRRGLGGMLPNPQSLGLLLRAVAKSGGRLPKSRREAFEQACLALAAEQNDQHLDSGRVWPEDQEIVDAASEVCALVLLSGGAGVCRHGKDRTADWAFLGNLPDHPREVVEAVLGTTLFKAASESHRFEPVHRVVAEFLAARRLAAQMAAGVPIRRALRLITVDSDGGAVPTSLRGLAAWLSALCPPVRRRLIHCDPVGVAAYGDTSDFSTEDKERLLAALGQREPEFGSWVFPEALVEALSGPDMEPAFINILDSPERDEATQVVAGLTLRALGTGEPRPHLLDRLMAIVRDSTRWPIVHRQALDAFLHNGEGTAIAGPGLRGLLDDIRDGKVSDEDRELSGTLLLRMYPSEVAPADIWTYLLNQPKQLMGRDDRFWIMKVVDRTPEAALPEAVDALAACPPEFWRALVDRHYWDLPLRMVARAVTQHGDSFSTPHLYGWLRVGFRDGNLMTTLGQTAISKLRDWFGTRPDLLRDLWRTGIELYVEPDDFGEPGRDVRLVLGGVEPPPDFGRFCLAQAVVAAPESPTLAYWLLQQAFERSPAEGIPLDEVKERACRSETLANWVPDFLSDPKSEEAATHPWRERHAREVRRHQAKRREQDAKWEETVRSNLEVLRANCAEPWLLERLAWEYLGTLDEYAIGPRRGWRIQAPELRSAAVEGLRGTPWRDDVPDERDLFRLHREGRRHLFGPPVLAGLEIVERGDPQRLDSLGDVRRRRALAFYYIEQVVRREPPNWYRLLVRKKPQLVADTLVRWAKVAFRQERSTVAHIDSLCSDPAQAEVARRAAVPLLTAFSVRKGADWHTVLDQLLWTAIAYADRNLVLDLLDRKLAAKSMTTTQRVHWLAAALTAAPDRYRVRFEEQVGDEESMREAATFFCGEASRQFPASRCDVATLRMLVLRIGALFPPIDLAETDDRGMLIGYINCLPDWAASLTERCIDELASRPAVQAGDALRALCDEGGLAHWRPTIERACRAQDTARRDAEYRIPSIGGVVKVLCDTVPTSTGNLGDLVLDHLDDLNEEIRWNDSNIWRNFWSEDGHGKPDGVKSENSCRDALADLLHHRLDDRVQVRSEERHAGGFRSDLRLTVPGSPHSVSIEIKFDGSPDLWTAGRDQLIRKYLAPGDHGIYLVLWSGSEKMPPPPTGARPTTPEALEKRLRESLTPEECDRVKVRVLDVRSPQRRFIAEGKSGRTGSGDRR